MRGRGLITPNVATGSSAWLWPTRGLNPRVIATRFLLACASSRRQVLQRWWGKRWSYSAGRVPLKIYLSCGAVKVVPFWRYCT